MADYDVNKRLPKMVPLFPLDSFTPNSKCAHKRRIKRGSIFCCMICHQSGVDLHPALRRSKATDPKPEPKASKSEDRKNGRKKQHAAKNAASVATKQRLSKLADRAASMLGLI